MVKDRYYVWLNRFYYLPLLVLGLMLLGFGGWSVMLWGSFSA